MRADVSGQNVGYVYFFTGYLDKQANALNVADTDYLDSPQTRELNGVYYPDWGVRSQFTLDFDWEPLMFAISDGQTTAQVLLQPQSYGAKAEEAVYTVDGIYTFAGDNVARHATLYFSNGLLRTVLGFTSDQSDGTGAPREIIPQTGDRFTVLEKWLDLDASGKIQKVATPGGQDVDLRRADLDLEATRRRGRRLRRRFHRGGPRRELDAELRTGECEVRGGAPHGSGEKT